MGIHRWPVNSPHKGTVTRKMFPFDDVIMAKPSLVWDITSSRGHTTNCNNTGNLTDQCTRQPTNRSGFGITNRSIVTHMLFNKDLLTWLPIAWRLYCQSTWSHVWKSADKDFSLQNLINLGPYNKIMITTKLRIANPYYSLSIYYMYI